jgi:hypothetical protein
MPYSRMYNVCSQFVGNLLWLALVYLLSGSDRSDQYIVTMTFTMSGPKTGPRRKLGGTDILRETHKVTIVGKISNEAKLLADFLYPKSRAPTSPSAITADSLCDYSSIFLNFMVLFR